MLNSKDEQQFKDYIELKARLQMINRIEMSLQKEFLAPDLKMLLENELINHRKQFKKIYNKYKDILEEK